jgi:hypothetical protein
MIFPHLPKHYEWIMRAPELQVTTIDYAETPLHDPTEPTGSSRITVEEWWIKHGLARDPAAAPLRSRQEPIDWLARDALEFYALCLGILCWIVYWYGVHHGAW